MIKLINITKIYSRHSKIKVTGLEDVNIEFNNHGLIFILGKSGSGKTTFMNLLGGLDRYDKGDMIIENKSTINFTSKDWDAYRNSYVGFIFQDHNLIEEYTLTKNISLTLELQGVKSNVKDIHEILKQVDLENYGDRYPSELSTGQKQRVAIARALIKKSKLILADEPTGSLDLDTSHKIFKILKQISRDKLVIVVSHDREFANIYGDRIIEIKDGKVILDQQLIKKPSQIQSEAIMKKSQLSWKNAIELAFNSMKLRPLKLLFLIMITTFAFLLFGVIASISHYNIDEVSLQSMYDNKINYVTFERNANDRDLELLSEQFPNNLFSPIFDQLSGYFDESLYAYEYNDVFNSYITGGMEINTSIMEKYEFKLIAGTLPTKNPEDNEIVISDYLYKHFERYGYYDNHQSVKIESPTDLVGKRIFLNDKTYFIVGIIDTNFDVLRYERLLTDDSDTFTRDILFQELESILNNGLQSVVFVRDGYFKDIYDDARSFFNNYVTIEYWNNSKIEPLNPIKYISKMLNNISSVTWLDNQPRNELTANEIIIPSYLLNLNMDEILNFDSLKANEFNQLLSEYAQATFPTIQVEFDDYFDCIGTWEDYQTYILTRDDNPFDINKDKTYFEKLASDYVKAKYYLNENIKMKSQYYDYNIKVVGITNDENLYVSDEFFESLHRPYNLIATSLSHDYNRDLQILKFGREESGFPIQNQIITPLNIVNSFLVSASKIAFYIALVILAFTAVLQTNYILMSIFIRKRDIGILRAIGATQQDVFIIFIYESLLISLVSACIGTIELFIAVHLINNFLKDRYELLFTFLNINVFQVMILFSFSILVSLFATFLPIYKFSKKQPIDVIKSL